LPERFRNLALAGLFLFFSAPAAFAADGSEAAPELRDLLDRFLAAADDPAMHERFWDASLIYTSSSGTRFGKSDILEGLREEAASEDAGEAANVEPAVRYRAEDVQVMNFGDIAVVAFRLVGDSAEGTTEYFNTGTFRRLTGEWRAVAWQATRIPDD
jgi:hypothetical protein